MVRVLSGHYEATNPYRERKTAHAQGKRKKFADDPLFPVFGALNAKF